MVDTNVMVAQRSVMVDVDGTPTRVRRRHTMAQAGHPIVAAHPDLWAPLVIAFPAERAPGADDDLERYREHSEKLNSVAWRIADALGDIPPGATVHEGDIDDLVDRLLAKVQEHVVHAGEVLLTAEMQADLGLSEAPKPAAKDVRAWAKAQGIDVPGRGPIPDDIIDRYRAAHTES